MTGRKNERVYIFESDMVFQCPNAVETDWRLVGSEDEETKRSGNRVVDEATVAACDWPGMASSSYR
jgi:hypothetical protein